METAGLVVGIAGLTGLFSSCLEAADKVQSYLTFGADSQILDTRFKASKVRLEQWGRKVGIVEGKLLNDHHPALDNEDVNTAVKDLLQIIKRICDIGDVPPLRVQGPGMGTSDMSSLNRSHPSHRESRRRKVAWTLWDKGQRTEQVELFEKLVRQLQELVPADADRGITLGRAWFADLQRVIEHIGGETSVKTRRELHSWLGVCSPNEHYDDSLQKKLAGTCDWIFSRQEFQEWVASEFPAGPKLLWIHGAAGFGKTILCARVVEHISYVLNTPVSHFFYSSDVEGSDDSFVAIRNWLSQIVSQHDGAFDCVRQAWETHADPVASRATIISLFTRILKIAPGSTFVVDGLDECPYLDNDSISVTKLLRTVVNSVANTHTRILVVSRDVPEIRHSLVGDVLDSFAEYKITPDDVRSDTTAYSRDIVDRKLSNKTEDVRSKLSETMNDRCEGQFLWLTLQKDCLRRGMNSRQLQRAIEETPTGLDRVYDQNWARITRLKEREMHRAFSLLRWAALAMRPLTVCEITEAVVIEDADDLPMEDLPDDTDHDYVESEILGLCGSLLEIRCEASNLPPGQWTVHLPHFTVRQYLLCNLPTSGWIRQNDYLRPSHEQLQHTLLAKACLHYIRYRRVWEDVTRDSASPLGVSFLGYVAMNWHKHVNSGIRSNPEVIDLAIKFFLKDQYVWNCWRTFADSNELEGWNTKGETVPPGYLYYAVALRLKDVATSLISEHHCNVNETSSLGRSALGVACSTGDADTVIMLLEKGANIAVTSKFGLTPLMLASIWGHSEVVKLLLDRDAEVKATDCYGWTALTFASEFGDLEVVEILLDQSAEIETRTDDGDTPLMLASSSGHASVARLLLDKGADVTLMNNEGWTPLIWASVYGHLEVVRLLLRHPRVEAVHTDKNGHTALFLATRYGQHQIVQELLSDGRIDPRTRDWNGSTALLAAVVNAHVEILELLLADKMTLEDHCGFGGDLIWWARRTGNLRVVQLLIQHAQQIGFIIDEKPVSVDLNSVPFQRDSAWCDACTVGVLERRGYFCEEDNSFLICDECFDRGIRCPNSSHALVPSFVSTQGHKVEAP